MIEQALYITRPSSLEYFKKEYSRIYFGNEFCQRLIPSPFDLEKVALYTRKEKIGFSFVTPYVTDEGIEKLDKLFTLLEKLDFHCEVIINDWGVLNLINERFKTFKPVLGRLLTKQKRGPRLRELLKRETARPRLVSDPKFPKIKNVILQKKLPLSLDPYYKGSNVTSAPVIQDYLVGQRVKRIELDNTYQGLHLELPKDKIRSSLYFPYTYISTTFFCPSAGCEEKERSLLKIKACTKECQSYLFELRHKTMPGALLLKGNTIFYKNMHLSKKGLEKIGVDRIVHEPEIPI
jgi:hypothetical protein